jgi:hypothetical protein
VLVLDLSCGSVFVFLSLCVYVYMYRSRVDEPSGFRVFGFVGALGVFLQKTKPLSGDLAVFLVNGPYIPGTEDELMSCGSSTELGENEPFHITSSHVPSAAAGHFLTRSVGRGATITLHLWRRTRLWLTGSTSLHGNVAD